VLTATCLSYGRLCDFLGFFFANRPGGHTPRPILTQNGSNDVGSRKDVPFGVKIATCIITHIFMLTVVCSPNVNDWFAADCSLTRPTMLLRKR